MGAGRELRLSKLIRVALQAQRVKYKSVKEMDLIYQHGVLMQDVFMTNLESGNT